MIHVGPPPAGGGRSQEFSSVGATRAEGDTTPGWAGWWLFGTLELPAGTAGTGLRVQRGQEVRISGRLRLTSPALNCSAPPKISPAVGLRLEYLFGTEGRPLKWAASYSAFLFTPTGLPIEYEGESETRQLAAPTLSSLACLSPRTVEGTLQASFTVPADLPEGIYRPQVVITPAGMTLDTNTPIVDVWFHAGEVASLPVLVVGSPGTPRIPWTLLGDYPIDGRRGLPALEETDRWTMFTRVRLPARAFVVPRLDERTGEPIPYRLEPGSNWVSSSDRRLPSPPHIPLAAPAGELRVVVRKPNGSTDVLGPALLGQSSVRTPSTPGGDELHEGTGQVSDLYHLTALDDTFVYRFGQYGIHFIRLEGQVRDIYGNSYPIASSYEVVVARVLDLDPAQLPTTPYVQGDYFAPGLHVFPPVPAEVNVELVHLPNSDPAKAITRKVTGRANRFGYFQPAPGGGIRLEAPGEFRVDITASYQDPDGTLWMGSSSWGNVVEGPNAQIEAHGRRGMDYKNDNTIDDMPAWFEALNLPTNKQGIEVYYPYFSGDIHWGDETLDRFLGDSIMPTVTIRDKTPGQRIYQLMRSHWPRARGGFRWPPMDASLTSLNKRIAVGEAPLFLTTSSGMDPAAAPGEIDMWGYWYGTSERPDVTVREVIAVDNISTAYWRFNDTYDYQIGEGAMGDVAGDLKWEFGGAVFRVPSQGLSEYAVYSSLWALLPRFDAVGARITPPFQDATGASINGGPIMQLKGKDVDMLFLPKGVRPGDVLEVGDVVAFSGHVGPPLDSLVAVTIASPGGAKRSRTFRANKIGWVYDPSFDFVVNEAGRWTVYVYVLHDRPYVGNGVTPARHNTGTVLGTDGSFEFYVVPRGSSRIELLSPSPGFLSWPNGKIEPTEIRGVASPGATAVLYTIHDKGVVIAQGSVQPDAGGGFSIRYDAKTLNAEFPFISLTAHEGRWEGLADEVSISLLAVGGSELRANTVTLIGEEVFIGRGPS
jgi:hypothetical protein